METFAATLKTSDLVNELLNRGWLFTARIKPLSSIVVSDPDTGETFEQKGPATMLIVPDEVMNLY